MTLSLLSATLGQPLHPNAISSWVEHANQYSQPTDWMVLEAGYPVETHDVVTQDGYILTLHRIPATNQSSRVVFLQHGLMSSSADWVLSGPDHALAYQLAQAGYDVWMGNFRGNQSVFSTLIGGGPSMFCSHWSRWFTVLLYQHFYAIKNQQKARNTPSRGLWVP